MKNRQEIVRALAKTPEDKLCLSRMFDRLETAQQDNYTTSTKFLDLHEHDIVQQAITACHAQACSVLWGGYDDAERTVAIFYPDYLTQADAVDQAPLVLLRATGSAQDVLSHRDYLGALMGLQIDRNMVGDILVYAGGADMVVHADIADFIAQNFLGAGRKKCSVQAVPFSEIRAPQRTTTEGSGTVATLRLDSVGALMFGVSRAVMQERIAKGLVYRNHAQCMKNDTEVACGDLLTVRGAGRGKITEIGGISKKGRQFIAFERTK